MQLLCKHSEENNTDCLGIVPVKVRKFQSISDLNSPSFGGGQGEARPIKIPQMGWNTIYELKSDLFNGVRENSYIYNVHSYYAGDSKYTIAKCNYGVEYAAAVRKDNFYGVQFHTEKSAETGDKIIKNFLEL
jgi:glutamine amidotransferase